MSIEHIDDTPNEGPAPNPDFSRAYIVPDSGGGYIAGSSDGYEMLTSASTPDEALEDLTIAKKVDSRGEEDGDSVDLENVIADSGFDPKDFEL
jgi:hypothetical protein